MGTTYVSSPLSQQAPRRASLGGGTSTSTISMARRSKAGDRLFVRFSNGRFGWFTLSDQTGVGNLSPSGRCGALLVGVRVGDIVALTTTKSLRVLDIAGGER
jgi:hypothetical protein